VDSRGPRNHVFGGGLDLPMRRAILGVILVPAKAFFKFGGEMQ